MVKFKTTQETPNTFLNESYKDASYSSFLREKKKSYKK